MTSNSIDPARPFDLTDPSPLEALRDRLLGVAYTQETVDRIVKANSAGGRVDLPLLRSRLRDGGACEQLFRVFHLGDALSAEELRDVLGVGLIDSLLGLGLLVRVDGAITARAKVMPFRGLYLASDFSLLDPSRPLQADHVPAISASTRLLATLAPQRRADAALDIGTGTGAQALLAARHVVRAVGTDTNPRALNFASLNATLNGIGNLELLEGSFYEPIATRTFDLVLSNPPFVISPETRFLYRDAGVRGDAASEHVIRGMPRHLREGGFGVVLCNWQHGHDDDWPERPQQWTDGSSCDVWVLRFDTLDRLGYAAFWLRQTEEDDPDRYSKLLSEWTRYYEEIGMERVSIGAIILKKRTGATNWFRADKTPGNTAIGDCGEHIEAIFAAEDLLHAISDDRELMDVRFRINPAHVLEARMVLRDGSSVAESLRLKLTAGIPFAGAVDPRAVNLLAACDGGRPLRSVVADLAAAMELDTDTVAHTALALVKQFLRSGVLRLAGPPD